MDVTHWFLIVQRFYHNMRYNKLENTCRRGVLLKKFLTVLEHEKGKKIVDLLI